MNDFVNSINTVTNPEQAVEEYMGEQFIEWLISYISHEMQGWDIVKKIKTAKPKEEKIKKLILQVFLAREAFLGGREGDPGFLRFAIANLSESDDPQAESALETLEKRRQDELAGHKIEKGIIRTVRRERWVRLLKALGLSEEEIDKAEPKEPTRNFIAELSEVYSTYEWQTAVGAMAAYDKSVTEEFKVLIEFLKNNTKVSEKDLEALNNEIVEQHSHISHILEKVVFDKEAKNLVWQGVVKQLEIRKDYLTGLEKYLEN